MPLVLSLFPGIGLLDMAFEEVGFCVVRGPDLLWGGDVRSFHPPAERFDGVIGGPPCQAHSTYAQINRAIGNTIAPDLIPEFVRCVDEARPTWWLAENVPNVPSIEVEGYSVTSTLLDTRWLGEPQSRLRRFQFGTASGMSLQVETVALENPEWESACLATEGRSGRMSFRHRDGKPKTTYSPRRPFARFCELQGLPQDYLSKAPFTVAGKYRAVGNGVPLTMGRAIARAVKHALSQSA